MLMGMQVCVYILVHAQRHAHMAFRADYWEGVRGQWVITPTSHCASPVPGYKQGSLEQHYGVTSLEMQKRNVVSNFYTTESKI